MVFRREEGGPFPRTSIRPVRRCRTRDQKTVAAKFSEVPVMLPLGKVDAAANLVCLKAEIPEPRRRQGVCAGGLCLTSDWPGAP